MRLGTGVCERSCAVRAWFSHESSLNITKGGMLVSFFIGIFWKSLSTATLISQ